MRSVRASEQFKQNKDYCFTPSSRSLFASQKRSLFRCYFGISLRYSLRKILKKSERQDFDEGVGVSRTASHQASNNSFN